MNAPIDDTHASPVTLNISDTGIASVILNRPEKHNAFDDHLILGLQRIFRELENNKTIRCMILSGNGKSFSAGADINWMASMATASENANYDDELTLANLFSELNQLPFPTIAKVRGAAFGGAIGLISCCDIAIAASDAAFSLPEVKIGLIPATISPYVINAIGSRNARRYFLTAERFSAAVALHIGLLSETTPANQLDERVDALARAMLCNAPQATARAKQLIAELAEQAMDDKLTEKTSRLIAGIRASAEGVEGLSAFLEKRPPNWMEGI